jgi:ribonucleotide monophosphatase NagD (HAD superfamily)
MLRAMDKQVFFVTNNSAKSRAGFLKKFQSLKIQAYADGM